MKDQETNKNVNAVESSADITAAEDAELKKATGEIEDLKQTLIRHQADFANFRKRAEKEREQRRGLGRAPARSRDHGALNKLVAGQRRVETGPRLVRRADRGPLEIAPRGGLAVKLGATWREM